jgi:anti-sigma B factor antagonist
MDDLSMDDLVFEIDRSGVDGQARLRFVGELDMAEVERARREVLEVLDETAGALIIDLGGLTFCDSTGVHLLFKLDAEVKARERTMVLQDPTPAVREVLRLLGAIDRLTVQEVRSARF